MTHHGAANKPHVLEELDADVVVSEEESEKKFVCNTVGTKGHAHIDGGWNKRHST
jgi:hypothetical protein